MAALTFYDSLLDRILGSNGVSPPGYNPAVDGSVPEDWAINGNQFAVVFIEVQQGRFDDHVSGGPVVALETFWNILAGGEGETELNWLVARYGSVPAENQYRWARDIAPLFSMIEIDSGVGLTYRDRGANGYTNKQNLKNWVDQITLDLGGTVP